MKVLKILTIGISFLGIALIVSALSLFAIQLLGLPELAEAIAHNLFMFFFGFRTMRPLTENFNQKYSKV